MIKLSLIATLKGHVQILNVLLGKGFRKIRAYIFKIAFVRSNDAPELGGFWHFLTMCKKQKALQIQYLQGFERIEEI